MNLEAQQAEAPIVAVDGLRKVYGATVAVDGISFTIPAGSIFGLVGPNGAGKTTTMECIEGVRTPDAGSVRVLGMEPVGNRVRLYQSVGVQLQENSLPPRQRVREALRVFASLYPNSSPVGDVLAECGLEKQSETLFRNLSGGQKRRLLLGMALIGRPRLLILDEPTSGLDPQARRSVWRLLERYRARGTTILLTTHDMFEAQEQCDTICIVDHGRILAQGEPAALLRGYGMEYRAALPAQAGVEPAVLRALPEARQVEEVDGMFVVYGSSIEFLPALTRLLAQHGLNQGDMETRRARLEDLFLLLTGYEFREG